MRIPATIRVCPPEDGGSIKLFVETRTIVGTLEVLPGGAAIQGFGDVRDGEEVVLELLRENDPDLRQMLQGRPSS